MMDFKNAKELLHLCEEAGSSISDIMLKREIELGEISEIEALARMEKAFHIMRDSARTPVKTPVKSMGGLIGGEARKLSEHQASGNGLCGPILEKAITYAMGCWRRTLPWVLLWQHLRQAQQGLCRGSCLRSRKYMDFLMNK